jgi:hypothetical protein
MRNPFNNARRKKMGFDYVTFATDWAGIPLSINYCPDWCNVTAHLEISTASCEPLPRPHGGAPSTP